MISTCEPIKIGNINLKSPFLLAPLAGYTDKAFREMTEGWPGLMYTEMVSAKALFYKDKKSFEMLDKIEGFDEAIQLFGNEASVFYDVISNYINKTDFKLIDINLGCPAPKIVKNKMGSYLIKEPQVVGEIVRACKQATDKPITIKIRKSFEEVQSLYAIEAALENGVDAICVHGRKREDFYKNKSDYKYIKKVADMSPVCTIANGDIDSYEKALDVMAYTSCKGVLIGRSAIGSPQIFKEFAKKFQGLSFDELGEKDKILQAIRHLNLACEYKGERLGVCEMRKNYPGYLKGINNNASIRNEINTKKTKAEVEKILYDLLKNFE